MLWSAFPEMASRSLKVYERAHYYLFGRGAGTQCARAVGSGHYDGFAGHLFPGEFPWGVPQVEIYATTECSADPKTIAFSGQQGTGCAGLQFEGFPDFGGGN